MIDSETITLSAPSVRCRKGRPDMNHGAFEQLLVSTSRRHRSIRPRLDVLRRKIAIWSQRENAVARGHHGEEHEQGRSR
jgi:hypothetical protein